MSSGESGLRATWIWRTLRNVDALRTLYHRALNLRAYVGRWGTLEGLFQYARLRLPVPGLVEVTVPGFRHAVRLRRGTSDVHSFDAVFVQECYGVRLPPGPGLIVDGGANVGHAAAYFAERFPEKRIVAVEPEASNVAVARMNTGCFPQVEVREAALWGHAAQLRISNREIASHWAYQVEATEGENHVTCCTIEELAGAERIDLVKLDVEGSEREIFAGRPAWVDRVDVFIVEFHDRLRPGCEAAFKEATRSLSLTAAALGENVVFWRSDRPSPLPNR